MERMVSIASQTSGVRACELARAAEHYDVMRPLLDKNSDILCPSVVNPSRARRVQPWRSHYMHHARLGHQMLSALVYLKCNEHVAV